MSALTPVPHVLAAPESLAYSYSIHFVSCPARSRSRLEI